MAESTSTGNTRVHDDEPQGDPRKAGAQAGGALVVVDGAPEVKTGIDTWGPVPAQDLMRRVKEQFDPERRLAPGRFVGGI